MKYLFPLFLVLASGCTPLAVKEPVGEKFSLEALNKFEGVWMLEQADKDPTPVRLKKMNDEGLFRTAHVEWKKRDQHFQLHESDLILREGKEFGILHLVGEDDRGEPLFLISLFKIDEQGKLRHWATDNERAKTFLRSGQLKTQEIDGELVIIDEPEKVVRMIEANFESIFDADQFTTATKWPTQSAD